MMLSSTALRLRRLPRCKGNKEVVKHRRPFSGLHRRTQAMFWLSTSQVGHAARLCPRGPGFNTLVHLVK
jgi:hypothetical protein